MWPPIGSHNLWARPKDLLLMSRIQKKKSDEMLLTWLGL